MNEYMNMLGAAGMSFFDSWYNNRSSMDRQHDAQDFSREMYQNRYTYTVKDLINAGLNPMLAYGHGPGSSPSSGIASSAGGSRMAENVNQARMVSAQEGALSAEAAKKVQEARTLAAQEKNIDVDTMVKGGMPQFWAAMTSQAMASAESAKALTEKIRAEIPMVQSQIKELEQRAKTEKADMQLKQRLSEAQQYINLLNQTLAALNDARTKFTDLESRILNPKAKAASTWSAEVSEESEYWGKIGKNTWRLFNPFSFGQ